MKSKILLLFVIITMIYVPSSFASITEIPTVVYDTAVDLAGSNNFVIFYNSDGNYSIIYGSNLHIYTSGETIGSGSDMLSSVSLVKSIDFEGHAWTTPTLVNGTNQNIIESSNIVYARYDVLNYIDKTVFFSQAQALPLQVQLMESVSSSIVPSALNSLPNILAVGVGILGLMMGVSLIPRVLYKLF